MKSAYAKELKKVQEKDDNNTLKLCFYDILSIEINLFSTVKWIRKRPFMPNEEIK